MEQGSDEVRVYLDGTLLTSLRYGSEWDKPFLYPLRSVSGVRVSRGYPVEPRAGEESDHDWHRGIWYGHGDINGVDFWRELGRDRTGRIVLMGEPVLEERPGNGSVEARFGFRTPAGERIGSVTQSYAFSVRDGTVLIDVDLALAADAGSDLRFADTEDGGFAMRLADEFRQERGAILANAQGLRDTERIWGQASRWVDYSSAVDGREAGVAIFDHPSNLRHPTRWHARGYSLCSANPFGERDFTGDEEADGKFTVPAGQVLALRYRVVIHEGGNGPPAVERWYQEFAAEPAR